MFASTSSKLFQFISLPTSLIALALLAGVVACLDGCQAGTAISNGSAPSGTLGTSPPSSPPSDSTSPCDQVQADGSCLIGGRSLAPGESWSTGPGGYPNQTTLSLQTDGNLVLYHTDRSSNVTVPLWASQSQATWCDANFFAPGGNEYGFDDYTGSACTADSVTFYSGTFGVLGSMNVHDLHTYSGRESDFTLNNTVIWETKTNCPGCDGATLVIKPDGNMFTLGSDGVTYFNAFSGPLQMQNCDVTEADGTCTIHPGSSGRGLQRGQAWRSATTILVLQGDGNLVLYDTRNGAHNVLWAAASQGNFCSNTLFYPNLSSTPSNGDKNQRCVITAFNFDSDGNGVAIGEGDRVDFENFDYGNPIRFINEPIWSTDSNNPTPVPDATLAVQSDGNVVIKYSDGSVKWSTNTKFGL